MAETSAALKSLFLLQWKGVRMNKKRLAKQVTLATGCFFLCAGPGLTFGYSNPPGPAQTPHVVSPGARPKTDAPLTDDFAGLTLTDAQKAKIDQIRQSNTVRTDAVVRDEKLTAEQKRAMLDGYRRMESGEIFKSLTLEQQAEVRKRLLARRAAAQQEEQQKKQSPPK